MKTLTRPHFSLADWEFEAGHHYFISTVEFVSPPSSLCTPLVNPPPTYSYCYLKEALAKCVSQGKFITWWNPIYKQIYLYIFFRQQTPLVHSGDQDGYRLEIDAGADYTRLFRYVAGGGALIGSYTHDPIPYHEWIHIKLKFWEYTPPSLIQTLRIELFFEEAGEWVSKGYLEDDTNPFADSDTNRIGFAQKGHITGNREYLDDTEVWRKTS